MENACAVCELRRVQRPVLTQRAALPDLQSSDTTTASHFRQWLSALVSITDEPLRRHFEMFEYEIGKQQRDPDEAAKQQRTVSRDGHPQSSKRNGDAELNRKMDQVAGICQIPQHFDHSLQWRRDLEIRCRDVKQYGYIKHQEQRRKRAAACKTGDTCGDGYDDEQGAGDDGKKLVESGVSEITQCDGRQSADVKDSEAVKDGRVQARNL